MVLRLRLPRKWWRRLFILSAVVIGGTLLLSKVTGTPFPLNLPIFDQRIYTDTCAVQGQVVSGIEGFPVFDRSLEDTDSGVYGSRDAQIFVVYKERYTRSTSFVALVRDPEIVRRMKFPLLGEMDPFQPHKIALSGHIIRWGHICAMAVDSVDDGA